MVSFEEREGTAGDEATASPENRRAYFSEMLALKSVNFEGYPRVQGQR